MWTVVNVGGWGGVDPGMGGGSTRVAVEWRLPLGLAKGDVSPAERSGVLGEQLGWVDGCYR